MIARDHPQARGARHPARALIAGARRRVSEAIIFRERGVAATVYAPSVKTDAPSTLQK
ncbi:protein of unknown function [Burkholderia multivorans]